MHASLSVNRYLVDRGELYMSDQQPGKGFFAALFDFSFDTFVTPMLVKALYVIVTVALFLAWIIAIVIGFTEGAGAGLLALIGGAVAVIIDLALIRMTLELYYAVIRMSEDVHRRRPQPEGGTAVQKGIWPCTTR